MFSHLLSDLIHSLLGTYIERFSSDELNASIFTGHVVLTNLVLRPSILSLLSIPLPLVLVQGHVDRIVLDVPLTSLGTRPVCVEVEGVVGVVRRNESGSVGMHKDKGSGNEHRNIEKEEEDRRKILVGGSK